MMSDLQKAILSCGFVDCSHLIDENTTCWPGGKHLTSCPFLNYDQDGYAKCLYSIEGGIGTHIDSPAHFPADIPGDYPRGRRTISDLTLPDLIGCAVLIDVSAKAEQDPDYELSVHDLLDWESRYGQIPEKAIVLMKTGWGKKFGSESQYRNVTNPSEAHPYYPGGTMHFPGFSKDAALFLVHQRTISGVGIDTLSLDPGRSQTFDCHHVMLSNNKFQIENMNLENVPEHGAVIAALPLKVRDAPEMCARVVAFVPLSA
eukprot:TRINITY_DN15205_c0_g1::TRINITY_DN15205_c0_g1_i1::g.30719::m.30719 TRINITY_DN15205_c0_g1::TRINITY_DN15205_c0_g1_i1::g.30719  ORF type:complete len:259 (-),score=-2.61,sp/Q2S2F5/KYNB_SALRD/27.42/6e-08,Cyclase/PF04199.8/1e-25 TRINITY_DN15205_c0_g1_i1:556-1332(-)